MEIFILSLFFLLLLFFFVYSLIQLNLLFHFLKNRNKPDTSEQLDFSNPEEIPFVTIQLPLYNEKPVVERLLKNIAEIDYPREKLEIQVLDDSTDQEALKLTINLVSQIKKTGLDISHIHRKDRTGFKAGALKAGLETAKGEFIAIFDSDFLPKKDWLYQTIPFFKNEKIGVVQTRWGHLNRNYSILTKLQAFALDFHFILEQNGRNLGRHFINFNGTAGVWRKSCILDAGNWSGDTLTEDLDLSYRAQLKNWEFKYLENVETPAELPITIAAVRSQQFRWNKGAAENFRKNYKRMRGDKQLPISTKVHGFFHLLNSSLFFLMLLLALLSLPTLYISSNFENSLFIKIIGFFGLSSVILFFCYWFTFARIYGKSFKSFLNFIPMFVSFFAVAIGLSVHNTVAVLEGHFGKKSEFIRTPKFNVSSKNQIVSNGIPFKLSFQLLIEILLLFYFGFAIYSAFLLNNFSLVVFHLMLFCGFAFVVVKTIFNK